MEAIQKEVIFKFLNTFIVTVFLALSFMVTQTYGQSSPAILTTPTASRSASIVSTTLSVEQLCQKIKKDTDLCSDKKWKSYDQKSYQGYPLIYAEFGNLDSKNVTLIFSMVHGDEYTPLYLTQHLIDDLKNLEKAELFKNVKVVVAPFVNPDGYFSARKTRVNARGVDLNRNLPTQDWEARALKNWTVIAKKDPRRYPGQKANSEVETQFQVDLIREYRPKKILTIHSPLNHLDYDGPNTLTLKKFTQKYVQDCLRLKTKVKAVSSGYYAGSLGNYGGNDLGIPTITLELPTTEVKKTNDYWKIFSQGIKEIIFYPL
jgi:protein MpaA